MAARKLHQPSSQGAAKQRRGASAERRSNGDVHLHPRLPEHTPESQPAAYSPLGLRKLAGALEAAERASLAFVEAPEQPEGSRQPSDNQPRPGTTPPNEPPAGASRRRSAVDQLHPSRSGTTVSRTAETPRERSALARNPRSVRYWRTRCAITATQLKLANEAAQRSKGPTRLVVPRHCYDLLQDIHDDARALAGCLEWLRLQCGSGVALEVEAAGLFRVRGGKQYDDWSCARARRKVALLVFLAMSPIELPRSAITGSTNEELMRVTCGVNQPLLVKLLCSSQRDPYCVRTLQRDLAEIDMCTDLLLRWRTPAVHAQPWERSNEKHGTMNRYCIRAGMIREQWRRARDATQALVKGTVLQFASWLVWRPAPAKGSDVPDHNAPAPAPA